MSSRLLAQTALAVYTKSITDPLKPRAWVSETAVTSPMSEISSPNDVDAASPPGSLRSPYESVHTYSLFPKPPPPVPSLSPSPSRTSPALPNSTPHNQSLFGTTPVSTTRGIPSINSVTSKIDTLSLSEASENGASDGAERSSWQEFSPPPELLWVEEEASAEIIRIVKESVIIHTEAARASQERHKALREDEGSRLPMIQNAAENVEQAGLQVVPEDSAQVSGANGSPVKLRMEGNRHSGNLPSNTTATSEVSRKGHQTASSVSSRSSSKSGSGPTANRSSSTKASVKSSGSKRSVVHHLTAVTVGPMGFMDYMYNASPVTQERQVAAKVDSPIVESPKVESPWVKKIKKFRDRKASSECIVCSDDLKNKHLIELACKHKYCKTCFSTFVSNTMNNEATFPPRCCLQEVSDDTIKDNLSAEQKIVYREKKKEFSMPSEDRWYCPSPPCGKWINTSKGLPSDFKCTYCDTSICTVCRGAGHADWEACPQDFALEATLEEASRNGWQRCFKCRGMVELTSGCRHMTCKCGGQFCYVCAAPWQTCHCTEEDQTRRQEEIQTRRNLSEQQQAELAEDLAAIARFEAEEAEANRVREEARRARAEQIRLDALAEQRRREEQHQQDIRAKFAQLKEELESTQTRQREGIAKRHGEEKAKMAHDHAVTAASAEDGLTDAKRELEAKNQERVATMGAEHVKALEKMEIRHQEEEDDSFLAIHLRLRGKPNRVMRKKALQEKVAQAQAEERTELEKTQKRALSRLILQETEEIAHLERTVAERNRLQQEQAHKQSSMQGKRIWADGEWFAIVVAQRETMLHEEEQRQLSTTGITMKDTVDSLERPMHPLEREFASAEYGVTY